MACAVEIESVKNEDVLQGYTWLVLQVVDMVDMKAAHFIDELPQIQLLLLDDPGSWCLNG